MVRIDVWDIEKAEDSPPINCGFPRSLDKRYTWGTSLGKGGFGQVKAVLEKGTGREYACKSICKRLDVPNFSAQRQAAHLDNIRREIAILRRLKGVLNVAQLKEALEDDTHIHIVMEYCRGGELWNCIGKRHYGEGTVASYMRAVLRTIAQCHANRILHRDVKPGNFMFLEDQPLSPVKAIDFGLAVFFEPGSLPRRDLGLEGTPWFMSPETLSSEVVPASDVWAAGVMAYQLLSGYLPFDDHKNRDQPALSKVWKAILTEQVSFKGSAWQSVPDIAKDFVMLLLSKDPAKRPSAQEALKHPWLLNRHKADRNSGAPLERTVVQRIQRYGQGSVVKRTIFELIAQEIIKMAPEPPTPDPSHHSSSPSETLASRAEAEESSDTNRTLQMLSNLKRRKSKRDLGVLMKGPGGGAMEGPPLIHRDHHSVHAGMEYFMARGESVHRGKQALELSEAGATSVHGGSSYWRMMRATAAALKWKESGGQDSGRYMRIMPRDDNEREEQRKAARLALDTSAHASLEYQKILKQCASPFQQTLHESPSEGQPEEPSKPDGRLSVQSSGGLSVAMNGHGPAQKLIPSPSRPQEDGGEDGEEQVRGRHAYRQFLVDQDQRRQSLDSLYGGLASKQRSWSYSDMSLGGGKPSLTRKSLQLPIPHRSNSSSWNYQPQSFPRSGNYDADNSMGSSLETNSLAECHSSIPELPGMPSLKKVSFGSLDCRSIASSPGAGALGRGLDGSDRGRNYFGSLQEKLPILDPSSRRSPEGSTSGRKVTAFASLLSLPAAEKTPSSASSGLSQGKQQANSWMGGGAESSKASAEKSSKAAAEKSEAGKEGSRLLGTIDTREMRELMRRLNFTKEAETVSEEDLAEGLRQLGYQLRPHEMRMLAEQVDLKNNDSGAVSKSAFLASQIDWHQEDLRELWLEAAKKVFADFEMASGGRISSAALTSIIRDKLPSAEVEYAVEDALVEAGYADEDEVDFDAFLRILKSEDPHSLDQFEARLKRPSSAESLQSIPASEVSQHGANDVFGASPVPTLPPVAE